MKTIHLGSTQIHSNTDKSIGFVVFPRIRGLEIPSIRLPSFTRPNVDGAVVPNQLYGGRLITFIGKVFADNVAAYRAKRSTLESAVRIMRSSDGVLQPIVLKFQTMDDLDLQVNVYTRNFIFPDTHLSHGDYKLDVFSPDLFILSQELKGQNIFVFQGGGMAITTEIPMDMSADADTIAELTNDGNVDAFPTVTLNGPLTNPAISNETTGKSFSLNYTLSTADESIVIDTQLRTVRYFANPGGSPTNIRASLSGDFITLAPGINNIKLSNTNYNATAYASVVWRDSYTGI